MYAMIERSPNDRDNGSKSQIKEKNVLKIFKSIK